MFYDPRISMGMLFTLIGTILTAFGLSTRSNVDVYARAWGSTPIYGGLGVLIFGIAALTLGTSRPGEAGEREEVAFGSPSSFSLAPCLFFAQLLARRRESHVR